MPRNPASNPASNPTVPLTGGCQCGGIRYEVAGRPGDLPAELYVCHCLECRRQSASAFGISLMVRGADLKVTRGTPRRWSRPADSGGIVHCHFCPDCGSRLFHGDPAREAEVSVKGGSLDQPVDLSKAIHIWTSRKLPGIAIPDGARSFPGEPE